MMFDDYEAYLEKYKSEYGENTLVLMECGSFYELYDDGSKKTDLKQIGELLNIQVSRRNKAIVEVSRNNLEMAGFPSYALKKFLHVLVDAKYTVVIVSQVTPPPNPKRQVTDIVSPGTYVDDEITKDTNFLMSIVYEENKEYRTNATCITIGASLVDLATGKTYVFETTSRANDILYPLDELYRIISSYNPCEFIITGPPCSNPTYSYDKLINYLDIDSKCVHNDFSKFENSLTKLGYQEELLRNVYKNVGMMSCVEYINLEMKPVALVSFVRLLQFVNNHNENVLQKIRQPEVFNENNTLTLSYNSVKQLDLVPQMTSVKGNKTSSLLDLLNNCKTSVGKRYFKERLLNPTTKQSDLESSYNTISHILEHSLHVEMTPLLSQVYDTERLFRKVDMKTLQPYELSYLMTSLSYLRSMCERMEGLGCNLGHNICLINCERRITEINALFENVVDKDMLLKFNYDNIGASIFKTGIYPVIDDIYSKYCKYLNFFEKLTSNLNGLHNGNETLFKLENNERDGYYLLITSKRFNEFCKVHKNSSLHILSDDEPIKVCELIAKNVSSSSSNVKVFHPRFAKYNEQLDVLFAKLKREVTSSFKSFLEECSATTTLYASEISRALALIDYYCCSAANAEKYRYNRPKINDTNSGKSYIKIKSLRHPIIERVCQDIMYVSNDVELGTSEMDGMLLYGLNSSGKSSLMKSIGIAVVMAQAGMFVPCDEMEFFPYQYVFTRILSSDDIFKGQSTFTKEMLELRGILKRANSNSLVIGDELCSGTESISALAIVSSGIYTLASRKSSFIFATHLHDLVNISEVNQLTNVQTFHLSVEYDNRTKQLIYDRKLRPGNGSTLYGLEVCKSLDLDPVFLNMANTIRQKLVNIEQNIVATSSQSVYNKNVYMKECKVCGDKASEVHHITQQKEADQNGYIGSFHKNDKFNLVALCEKCHNSVHHGNLVIHGYKSTSDGVILDYSNTTQSEDNTAENVKALIMNVLRTNPTTKRKTIIDTVQTTYNNLTIYKIDKIIKDCRSSL